MKAMKERWPEFQKIVKVRKSTQSKLRVSMFTIFGEPLWEENDLMWNGWDLDEADKEQPFQRSYVQKFLNIEEVSGQRCAYDPIRKTLYIEFY